MELEYERQEDGLDTNVYYMIKDPKHGTEKPYTLNYDPCNGFPRTNVENECKGIHVRNARTLQYRIKFPDCGFAVSTLKSKLLPDEFYNDIKVARIYYPECRKLLADAFPDAARVELLQHNTRKRHETFPIATGTDYEYTQPTTLVHLDYTSQRVQEISQLELGIAPDQYSRVVAVNLWKPIRGPVHDWPLALCDARSVNHNYDTIAADIVEREWVSENMRLYHNSKHRWYYYEGLRDDEVILFRQSDSEIQGGGGVPHTGFPNPNASKDAKPRESIELRAFVYFV